MGRVHPHDRHARHEESQQEAELQAVVDRSDQQHEHRHAEREAWHGRQDVHAPSVQQDLARLRTVAARDPRA